MKKYLSIVCCLLATFFLFGQSKDFTLEDCIYMNSDIFPKSMNNLSWMPTGNNFSYVENDTLFKYNVKNGEKSVVVTKADINNCFKTSTVTVITELKRFPNISWETEKSFLFTHQKKAYRFYPESRTYEVVCAIPEGNNPEKSNVNNYYAYTKGNDLFFTKDGKEICVAKSEGEGILYGSDRVHRSEFGITKGIFWSPADNYIAFYRMDESMVTDYPLVDITERIAEEKPMKYPMAGMTSHQVTLGIYDINSGETVYLNTGEPVDQYLTCISWDPNEKFVYIGILNREQNHLKLNKYDIVTGSLVKTLFEETDEQYVEPSMPLAFVLKDKSKFIWQSRRDGWNHLYLYDTEGNMIKQLTKGEWEVTDFYGFSPKEDYFFIQSTMESPIQRNIYSIKAGNMQIQRLTTEHGTHGAIFSYDKSYFIDRYSSTDVTRIINIVDKKGKLVKTLLKDTDVLADYAVGNITLGTIKSDDGSDLFYRMITPPGFDKTKQYPVFYYVYGGPHLQMITDSWNGGAGFWDLRWAQRGYIVFSLDNRGTPYRGSEFEQCIHRNLGTLEVDDQMKGVSYLCSLPYVDKEKFSVDGWSYGGFMTISLLLKHPSYFLTGVAGGPVIDWKYYEVMYGERYMDTPEENPEGYETASLLNYADNLASNLMIIHCTTDPVVVWQNSLTFIDKCIKLGKQVDYFVYPGHEHNVRGKDRMHLYQKIEKYIDEKIILKDIQ